MRGAGQFGSHHRASATELCVNMGSLSSLREHNGEGGA